MSAVLDVYVVLFHLQPLKIGVQRSGVGQPCEDFVIGGENLVPLNYQLIYRNYERFLDFFLVQMPVRACARSRSPPAQSSRR